MTEIRHILLVLGVKLLRTHTILSYYHIGYLSKVHGEQMSSFKKNYPTLHGLFGHVLNLRGWTDVSRLWTHAATVGQMVKRLFYFPSNDAKTASFTYAQKKFQLSEQALVHQQTGLHRLAWILFILGIPMIGYGVYSACFGWSRAVVVACVMGGISWVLAFRYHYWAYLISRRQLGCSIKEWFCRGILGKK